MEHYTINESEGRARKSSVSRFGQGNKSEAARTLMIARPYLHRLIETLEIEGVAVEAREQGGSTRHEDRRWHGSTARLSSSRKFGDSAWTGAVSKPKANVA